MRRSGAFRRRSFRRFRPPRPRRVSRTGVAPPGLSADDAPAELVAEEDSFGDLALRSAALPALTLDRQAGLFFGDAQIALQDPFRPIQHLPGLEAFRKLAVLAFEPGQFDFGADQEPDGGHQLYLVPAVFVRIAMLQVDDSHQPAPAEHRH